VPFFFARKERIMDASRIRLWDLPTRIFHWALVALFTAAVVTAQIGGNAMDWHGRIGLAIVGLLAFRVVWGFIGSTHSRFTNFMPSPASVSAYLRGQWQGVGHNPLGAFSVFALLLLIVVQFGTGLFANDEVAFNGFLASLVSSDLSNRLTGIHRFTINILYGLIALHVAAVAYYTLVRKESLVKPMVTGWKEISGESGQSVVPEPGRQAGAAALVVALVIALAAVYAASGAWIARPV
jgi:cytochrome b